METSERLRIRPLSVPGRYFLFAQDPPVVLMIDASTALVARLLDTHVEPTVAEERFVAALAAKGLAPETASDRFRRATAVLRDAGLTLQPRTPPGGPR